MKSSRITFIAWLLACLSDQSASYSNGKVYESCDSMLPFHGESPQTFPKHTIEVNVTEFKPGDCVKVSFSGPVFEGFLLQARNADRLEDPAIGSFALADRRRSQLLKCGHVKNSAVSHTSESKKNHMDAYWIAPRDAPKKIQFLVTVVQKFTIYWVKIPGPKISQPSILPLTSIMPSHWAIPTSLPVSSLSQPFSSSECGDRKFCVRNPTHCDPKANNCFFLSFKQDSDSVWIEMSGPSEGYIAFALSHDQWMGGGDDAYLCINNDHSADLKTAFLVGRSYPEFDSKNALENISWRLADGLIQCSFRRRIHLPASTGRYNLDANYYIFLADGEISAGTGDTIYKHQQQPLITNGKYNILGPLKDIGGSRSPYLIKIHGALMFIGWITTVSIGVIIARFFKSVWPHTLLYGEEIWFQIHRTLMIITILLTSVSFVLPFIYRGGWNKQAGFHPYFGCTVMALALFQPLMAAFRPPSHSPRRQYFTWLHWSVATTARILAVVTMFLGMNLPALNLPDSWDTYAMMGFVAWHVGIDVLLELHGYCLIRRVEVLEDDRIQLLQSLNSVEAQGHTFKKTVLFIYICGNIAFLVTFITAVVQV
ncbi:ferric-chelate reductase 1-like isoform X1 [Crotalus tigris]|uniref:ferric-chelate reductase 1-like isoform X1 n=1 Tax=Crotalus tigris TaxID=88082 RepID=UPI00192F9F0D|nr:ferric-chelate reductase 1-like isoform X1 [Crotalus tigris]XP_039208203.1 ferric-chelate reductase 1-like isoform X1 [Crotalus tigris]